MSALERLKNLFRELFQLDVADLDFGIFRLLHLKRQEVEAFLTKDLPEAVDKEFKAAAGAEQATLEKDLKELADRIRQDIGPDALQPNGEPAPTYANTKLVRNYVAKRKQLEAIEASEAQKAEVFNHLYAFFRRYYDEGDFIPRRFYGSRESYAVPYNGEEVLFHWANKDQHYVKTGEVFRDYTFKIETLLGMFTVRFKLVQVTTSKDNTKGDVRFFFALPKDAEYDTATRVFVVPFEYRLPTEAEVQRYGSGARGQDALTVEAVKKILAAVPDETLRGELAKVVDVRNPDDTAKREEVTLLLKRLRHFTKKNTTDYFIHKNLGGFLRQELEFYIKDQVVQAADLEGDFDAKRRMLRVFRALAEQVIAFLHQIEDAQRRLFEKKKFVLRTDYLIPIMHVPQELWPEVLANQAQLSEWKGLLAIEPKTDLLNQKGKINEGFLKEHPTLPTNTAHFDLDFSARLLATFEDVDEAMGGLLIHSENYQALGLVAARYARHIKCIYVDPPYNTGADDFMYKDRYQHSSWASMMHERLKRVRPLLSENAAILVQIGDEENANLKTVLSEVFGARCFRNAIVVRRGIKNVQSQFEDIAALAVGHDTVFLFVPSESTRLPKLFEAFPEGEPGKWDTFWRGTDRKTMRYEIFGIKPGTGQWRWSEERAYMAKENYERYLKDPASSMSLDEYYLHELTSSGEELDFVRLNKEKGESVVQYYVPPRNYKLMSDVWMDVRTRGDVTDFPTEKHIELVQTMANWLTGQGDLVLDFFGGSGTTAHAVLNLNREEGKSRQFIVVEMARYFDSHLLPRVQRIIYSPDWKDGKPKRLTTKEESGRTPRLVKVLRLESYEDALHNLAEAEARGRTVKKTEAVRATAGEERYRLNYLVKLPLEASDTMLNVEGLEHPFSYTIEVLTDDGAREQVVDLVETFNWLYGLRVKRLLTWEAKQGKEARKYRVVVATDRDNRKRILIVWRDMTNLDPKVERAFLEAEVAKLGDFEEKWINGNCAVPGVASLDGLFKRLMEHEA